MTGDQLRALRTKLGLSQADLARELYLTGTDPARTIRRWENEEVEITGPARKAFELIARNARIKL